jgi:hypothetical protein
MSEITTEQKADAEDWHERAGRLGFVAKGILCGIVGIVAIAVALGDEKKTADQTGALASLADSSAGKLLLIALAIGLGAYAGFRLIEVFVGPANEDGAKEKLMRVASFVRFVVYAALCVSAVRLVADAGKGGGNESDTTSTVFDLPAGRALVLIAGVVLVGVGIYQAYKAASTSFEDDLETGRMSPRMRTVTHYTGIAGHASRTIVYALIGGFLIKAAVEYDAKEAIGLDGALNEVAQQTFGPVLLFAVAVGLFVYGAFCLIEARYRKF